ncbi:MAG: FAD:protein FMN transferase [Halioglobus sp.]
MRIKAISVGWLNAAWLISVLQLVVIPASAEWHEQSRHLMGTEVSVELWHENARDAAALIESVFAEVQRLDLMMNPWNEASELARINREAGRRSVSTTREIFTVLERALHYSRLSDGAFDVSFAAVGQHFDYREAVRPTDEVIDAAKSSIDYRSIRLIPVTRQIKFEKPGMQIDLGGIAKGYAVDAGIALLKAEHVQAAVVTAGGDSRILGDMGDRPRTVGIRHPRKAGEYAVLIPLENTAISTSGDYERFFKLNGKRYHHILDPKTGHSAGKVRSASILAPTAMESDALSTTVFVLGVERGLALVNRLSGVDAIIIDSVGELHYSEELLLSP